MKLRYVLENIYNREEMPQVSKEDLVDAVKVLKSKNIPVSIQYVLPSKLKHSQKQVNKKKVLSIIKDIERGINIPLIVISSDNYIIDGHHRQLAYAVIEPDTPIKVIKLELSRDKAIEEYKKVEKFLGKN